MHRAKRQWLWTTMALVAIAMGLTIAFHEVISPVALTRTRMVWLQQRVIEFAKVHGRMPTGLQELALTSVNRDSTVDAWQQPIKFRLTSNDVAILSSFGADRKSGGIGQDADIEIKVSVRSTNAGLIRR